MPPAACPTGGEWRQDTTGPLRPGRQSQQTHNSLNAPMLRLPASGLDDARLPTSVGRRRAPRAPRLAAVPQAAPASSGGDGNEVQKLHAFLSASPPHQQQQQQQQGLSTADAYRAALPAPMVEDWSRLRVRRHMRLRRIEVDLPPALVDQQQQPEQQAQQQPEQQEQQQAQLSASAKAAPQQMVFVQQATDVQSMPTAPSAAAAVNAAQIQPAAAQPPPLMVQQQASVQAAEAQQLAQQQVQSHQQEQQVQQHQAQEQQSFVLPHVSTEKLSSLASGAAGRVAHLAQQTQVAAQDAAAEAAALGQQQLASLQQLTARQLGNLQQAARLARRQVALGSSGLQSKLQALQARPAQVVQQQAASVAADAAAAQTAAVSLQGQAHQAVQQPERQQQQLAIAEQGAPSQRQQQQVQQHMQGVVVQAAQPRRHVHQATSAAVAVPAPPPPPLPWQQAAVPGSFWQWLLAALAAASILSMAALRWLRGRRRQRNPQNEIRHAEQRARAARLYDRQRQRFQRALLAAEDLEGADSSVFSAVSRKGSVSAAGAAAGTAEGAHVGGAAGTGAAVLPPAAEAAVAEFVGAVHSMDADDDGHAAGVSTDVFDPASWDDETRKQWEAFVSSSKVNKGKLWDTNQVDEGLPAVWVDLNK